MAEFESHALRKIFPVLVTGEPPGHDEDGGPVDHGLVFVTPEYNHGYPATIKNAIDYLHKEWKDKPAGFVSYGGVAAGTRAVQQLKQVITNLRMVPVYENVNIPFALEHCGVR